MGEELIEELEREVPDHILILKSILAIPFSVGKRLLSDFVSGEYKNASIIKNNLDDLSLFGCLEHLQKDQAMTQISELIKKGLLEQSPSSFNPMIKVLKLTVRGQNEIINPKLIEKEKEKKNYDYESAEITSVDRALFDELNEFLKKYNDEQKKAIIDDSKKILCIAGAGSGKTTVLTKRIEFLQKYRSVPPEKMLGVTFTRKAKDEMKSRLADSNTKCEIETFNSFCEKILRKYTLKVYGRKIRVMNYNDKIIGMMGALDNAGIDMSGAINTYFTEKQKLTTPPEKLQNIFLNDCFSVIDYYKTKNKKVEDFSKEADLKNFRTAKLIYRICKYLENYIEMQGLRDFTDQLTDTVNFLEKNPELIPDLDHILIDEYQDINEVQVRLIDILNPRHLFCVGDPRQSIFGWRGSNIKYIKEFKKKYSDAQTIILNKNYRSSSHIVKFMNECIKDMNLPDVKNHFEKQKDLKLFTFSSEQQEFANVIEKILLSNLPRNEIFVLSRTNRPLNELSNLLKQVGIPHILKADEIKKPVEARPNEVILATIHSIKGLEATHVFVIGCNEQNFPCKASDHPVLEMIKMDDYDKMDEEKRLFYVAISRAKEKLHLSYSGKKPTYFITDKMMEMLDEIN